MTKIVGICMTGALATFLMPAAMVAAPGPYGAPVASGYVQDGWDVPPAEFDEMTWDGFHDAGGAALSDYKDGKQPDLNRHETYRHPSVPEKDREAFRRGFERGYRVATE